MQRSKFYSLVNPYASSPSPTGSSPSFTPSPTRSSPTESSPSSRQSRRRARVSPEGSIPSGARAPRGSSTNVGRELKTPKTLEQKIIAGDTLSGDLLVKLCGPNSRQQKTDESVRITDEEIEKSLVDKKERVDHGLCSPTNMNDETRIRFALYALQIKYEIKARSELGIKTRSELDIKVRLEINKKARSELNEINLMPDKERLTTINRLAEAYSRFIDAEEEVERLSDPVPLNAIGSDFGDIVGISGRSIRREKFPSQDRDREDQLWQKHELREKEKALFEKMEQEESEGENEGESEEEREGEEERATTLKKELHPGPQAPSHSSSSTAEYEQWLASQQRTGQHFHPDPGYGYPDPRYGYPAPVGAMSYHTYLPPAPFGADVHCYPYYYEGPPATLPMPAPVGPVPLWPAPPGSVPLWPAPPGPVPMMWPAPALNPQQGRQSSSPATIRSTNAVVHLTLEAIKPIEARNVTPSLKTQQVVPSQASASGAGMQLGEDGEKAPPAVLLCETVEKLETQQPEYFPALRH